MRLALLLALIAGVAQAQAQAQAQTPSQDYPRRLPASGGEVIIPSPGGQRAYDEIGFAPARRLGDHLYVSGVIVARAPDEGRDAAAFEAQIRRAYVQLDRILKASGAGFDDVAIINSFHVWDGPDFTGPREQQIEIMARVWREFSTGPRPAWTAVGTTGLLAPTGIVEIQLIAHAPAPDA